MSASIPVTIRSADCCQTSCDDVVNSTTPGPAGPAGSNGTNGTDGTDAFTALSANFTMPASLATAVATVVDSTWASIGQVVYMQNAGWLRVTAKADATHMTLQNLETATAYTENVAPATVIAAPATISPGGLQGPSGSSAGITLNSISPTTTKGDLLVDNGANSPSANVVRQAVGTNGQILVSDSTAGAGVTWKSSLVNSATDNAVPRFDGASGTPIPLQTSKLIVTDNGAAQASGSGGNARGADAIDLQVVRALAAQVASGQESVIAGGKNNTASGTDSVVCGGATNTASSGNAFVGGGVSNTASAGNSVAVGGNGNTASAVGAATVSGENNQASGSDAFVGGGSTNTASNTYSGIVSGQLNTASGLNSFVGSGESNTASGSRSAIAGGSNAVASLYGQHAQAAGHFATDGDAQTSVLVSRNSTTDATVTELFLDGSSATINIPSDTTWTFDVLIVARRTDVDDESAAYRLVGCIDRNGAVGTTALVGSVTKTVIAEDTAAWDVAALAENVSGYLKLTVTGEAAKSIRWCARTTLVQVSG